MSFLSISSMIESFLASEEKRYVTSYIDDGFELGFGRAGSYQGHSHLHFIDIIYSPDGIWLDGDSPGEKKKLVIAPARTYLPNIKIGSFIFLKFCPDKHKVNLPDKVFDVLNENHILALMDDVQLTFPWHANPDIECQQIIIELNTAKLTIKIGDDHFFVITK